MPILLPQLAEIRTGYQFRAGVKDETPAGTPVRVIQIKDIQGARISSKELETARMKSQSDRYLVRQNDVLLLMRGRHFSAALVDEPLQNAIASNFFFVLRLDKARGPLVLPAYLAWFLNHPDTQSALMSLAPTTHMPVVSRATLEALEIPTPPLQSQRLILRLDVLKKQEALLTTQLVQARASLFDALTFQLAAQKIQPVQPQQLPKDPAPPVVARKIKK